MNNKLELFVNGIGSTIGQIDLYGDEPISLSISIQDIKDISKRSSTVSQTFTIPANKNNNVLLNHIFNIGTDSSFDPRKKIPCYLLNDTVPVFTGNFQLTKINVKNSNVISYECVVYGETIDLVKTLGDKLIRGNSDSTLDLDFSELNHNRSAQTIEDSWTADTKSLGYYYPLIDYGYDLNISELNSGVLSINVDFGNVSSATTTTITDSSKVWVINAYATYQVTIYEGTGQGQTRTISSNTGTVLTFGPALSVTPDITSKFSITRVDTTNPYNTTGGGLNPAIFKPALSNSFLFKKILNNAGFSIDSTFIDSETFDQTIIPFNGTDNLTKPDVLSFKGLLSQPFTLQNFPPNSVFPPSFDLDFNNDSTLGGFDYSNLYNSTSHVYTAPVQPTVQQFMVDLSYGYNVANFLPGTFNTDSWYVRFYRSSLASGVGSLPNCYCQINYRVDKLPGGGTVYDIMPHKYFTVFGPILDSGATPAPVVPGIGGLVYTNNAWRYPTMPNEQFWVEISISNQPAVYHILDEATAFHNTVYTDGVVNNYIEMNDFIPKNIKQVDYVKSIITMFNLMVIPDKNNPKRLKFIPRNDYYGTGLIKDWTDKVDHTEKIEETLISEQQNRKIKLTYKADKDYYNADYTEKLNIIYGEYTKEIDNEWIDGEQKIEVIFSPTPVDKVFGSTDVFLPKIAKRDVKSGMYDRIDSNIRFLRKRPSPLLTTDTIQLLGMSARNTYPYCGHLDHPTTATIDYNFGEIKFAYYPELTSLTPNNLVNNYWKKFLDGIADKNSKLIKLKVYLTPNDIATFNYNDTIFIDQLTDDGGHYFIVNKITYIPTSNLPSVVELIKIDEKPIDSLGGRRLLAPYAMAPIKSIELGKNNSILSTSIVLGDGNTIGTNANRTLIVGDDNTIANNVSNVTLLGTSGKTITKSNTTFVVNTEFTTDGKILNKFNDLELGEDTVLNPFNVGTFNDVESGSDAVLNIGGVSPINDVDSGEDIVYTP